MYSSLGKTIQVTHSLQPTRVNPADNRPVANPIQMKCFEKRDNQKLLHALIKLLIQFFLSKEAVNTWAHWSRKALKTHEPP